MNHDGASITVTFTAQQMKIKEKIQSFSEQSTSSNLTIFSLWFFCANWIMLSIFVSLNLATQFRSDSLSRWLSWTSNENKLLFLHDCALRGESAQRKIVSSFFIHHNAMFQVPMFIFSAWFHVYKTFFFFCVCLCTTNTRNHQCESCEMTEREMRKKIKLKVKQLAECWVSLGRKLLDEIEGNSKRRRVCGEVKWREKWELFYDFCRLLMTKA